MFHPVTKLHVGKLFKDIGIVETVSYVGDNGTHGYARAGKNLKELRKKIDLAIRYLQFRTVNRIGLQPPGFVKDPRWHNFFMYYASVLVA